MFLFGFDGSQVTACMRKLYNKLNGSEFMRRRSSSKNLGIMKDNSGRSIFSSISVGQSTSYGIKTDPLIKFALFLCCIIHDAGKNLGLVIMRTTRNVFHSHASTLVVS
jgi:CRISPR/Cas system-associated endonuclease Cas3-HD